MCCFWNYLFLGWIGLLGSVMMLFTAMSIFLKNVKNDYAGVGVLFVAYLAAGVVLWRKRMVFLRAIAEPEAYPWVRLYLSFSVGTGILSAALLRILLDIIGRTISPAFSSMIVVALMVNGLATPAGAILSSLDPGVSLLPEMAGGGGVEGVSAKPSAIGPAELPSRLEWNSARD